MAVPLRADGWDAGLCCVQVGAEAELPCAAAGTMPRTPLAARTAAPAIKILFIVMLASFLPRRRTTRAISRTRRPRRRLTRHGQTGQSGRRTAPRFLHVVMG